METDPLQLGLYIGTMLFTSLIMGALMLVILCKPQLVSQAHPPTRRPRVGAGQQRPLCTGSRPRPHDPRAPVLGLLALSPSGPLERLLRTRLT